MKKDINKNITEPALSSLEKEEDLLEHIYHCWRKNEIVTIRDYAKEQGVTGQEIVRIVDRLVVKGYLNKPDKRTVPLIMTEKGKVSGMDYLAKHEKLTQFFQMISGMEEKAANKDACRMEHYISPEGLKGIEHFLQYGDVYDRRYDDMDLYTLYSDGKYAMPYGIYMAEQRNPRFLAAEYDRFDTKAALVIDGEKKYYELKAVSYKEKEQLWYNNGTRWLEAVKDNSGRYQIPADVFLYTANTLLPITEAVALIAITYNNETPLEEDIRELNIHIW